MVWVLFYKMGMHVWSREGCGLTLEFCDVITVGHRQNSMRVSAWSER